MIMGLQSALAMLSSLARDPSLEEAPKCSSGAALVPAARRRPNIRGKIMVEESKAAKMGVSSEADMRYAPMRDLDSPFL
jgi:hypothetical protein